MIHRVSFRAFAQGTEDLDRVREALAVFVPLDEITITRALGHFENDINILEGTLKKRDALAFFQILKEQLSRDDLLRLRREIPDRVDDNNEFHLRLDKQAAYRGSVALTDSRDAINVTALVESYPARRDAALRIVGELL